MIKRWTFLIIIFVFTLVACGTNIEQDEVQGNELITSETEAGDYLLRLISEKEVYEQAEEVVLKAKLKYIGEEEEKTIYHAMSPFWFDIVETTRGIEIPYVMNQPLLETTLERDVWFKETYKKSGSYSEEDENREFIEAFLEGESFPPGEYEIELRTDFFTEDENGEEKNHNYSATLMIQVKK
ncbi:hypothetical protein LGQ02_05215 [Bacillus shivajii]|uniref:hypothetical protein n=1 Tax=Bacillus shivajii TaxID=1983719 RepID=UPI001CF93CCA|nr:hypothetical protein [Bacillus shivajii]UCZ54164.1 hypothetical protein LGQ02_05215 [Bacillus shivajii]